MSLAHLFAGTQVVDNEGDESTVVRFERDDSRGVRVITKPTPAGDREWTYRPDELQLAGDEGGDPWHGMPEQYRTG